MPWAGVCCRCVSVCALQVLRVFLEADGNLRSNPAWRALKPNVLTPTQVCRHSATCQQRPAHNPAARTTPLTVSGVPQVTQRTRRGTCCCCCCRPRAGCCAAWWVCARSPRRRVRPSTRLFRRGTSTGCCTKTSSTTGAASSTRPSALRCVGSTGQRGLLGTWSCRWRCSILCGSAAAEGGEGHVL